MVRPRFSLRVLVIVVTVICAYFGAWEATKKWGVGGPSRFADWQVHSPAPLLVVEDKWDIDHGGGIRRYHLWLFGLAHRLPFETEL